MTYDEEISRFLKNCSLKNDDLSKLHFYHREAHTNLPGEIIHPSEL
jgi:hypothetical protein